MLKYVYGRLELLADEANSYVFRRKKFDIKKVEMNLESVKNFMAKLKDAFKDLPEALDEIEWLEMVVKSIERAESRKKAEVETVGLERE